MTGIMFCHETGGPITGWATKREGLKTGFCGWAGNLNPLIQLEVAPKIAK